VRARMATTTMMTMADVIRSLPWCRSRLSRSLGLSGLTHMAPTTTTTVDSTLNSTVVCVTGANGYIASYIVQYLLEKGYTVRGTVRSLADTSKFHHLLKMPYASERLRLYAADLVENNSFDEALEGRSSFPCLPCLPRCEASRMLIGYR